MTKLMSDKRVNILHVYHLIDVTHINVKIKFLITLLDRHPNWQTINKQKHLTHSNSKKRKKQKTKEKTEAKQNKRKAKQKQDSGKVKRASLDSLSLSLDLPSLSSLPSATHVTHSTAATIFNSAFVSSHGIRV